MLGKVALGARTPGEALARIVAALPYYCSHEQVSFERKAGQYVVREFFAHRFDPETKHTLLQYAAAMIDRILSMAGRSSASICDDRNSSASRAQGGAPSALVRRPCDRSGITRDYGADRGPGHGARL